MRNWLALLLIWFVIRCDSCGERWYGLPASHYVCPACEAKLDNGRYFRGVEWTVAR